ncbi:MAG: signal peptidase II [Gammaproteobacteria bacterium]|nr:signal peptidase II [Gammaproteobacteria bacterium]
MIKQRAFAFLLALVVILIDQATKYWVLQVMSLVDVQTILPVLDLRLAMNHGVAFSLFTQHGMQSPWVLIGFTSVLSAIIALMIFKSKPSEKFERYCYSLILGGALGNLIDRCRFGAVIDFIDCHLGSHHWPVFNLADSFICLGAFLLIIYSFNEGRHS